ncbi:hypothetical protein CPB85DRAFT_537689 [Mucidula mucida]|nr:hypothetical protein CPB85DRAFT_537689 [Mucidula mucida]
MSLNAVPVREQTSSSKRARVTLIAFLRFLLLSSCPPLTIWTCSPQMLVLRLRMYLTTASPLKMPKRTTKVVTLTFQIKMKTARRRRIIRTGSLSFSNGTAAIDDGRQFEQGMSSAFVTWYEALRIMFSDMEDVVGPSMNRREWLSLIEHTTWHNALISNRERCLDALAVLSETVGGVARQLWCETLSDQEMHGVNANCFPVLQALVILIMSSKAAVTDTIWWDFCTLYIPSQRIFHFSFDSSFLEGKFVMDFSPDRRSKDLAEVMRIPLPYFREMKARLNALSSNIGHSSDSASILGPSNLANLITCLDIAESISKLVPVFGDVLEGACGILRKTVQAAEVARSARNECRALAEHTASITLAILHEFGPTSVLSGGDFNRICDLRDTIKIVDSRVQSLSKLGRTKYLLYRGRINAEVMDLRAQMDNARIAFDIRNDISSTRLLTDLRNMQIHLASRVEDLYMAQKTTQALLETLVVEFRGRRYGDVHVDQAD